jgi:hypothetical protein
MSIQSVSDISNDNAAAIEEIPEKQLEFGQEKQSLARSTVYPAIDSDFPDGGLRAWLAVVGVSTIVIGPSIYVLIEPRQCVRHSRRDFSFSPPSFHKILT